MCLQQRLQEQRWTLCLLQYVSNDYQRDTFGLEEADVGGTTAQRPLCLSWTQRHESSRSIFQARWIWCARWHRVWNDVDLGKNIHSPPRLSVSPFTKFFCRPTSMWQSITLAANKESRCPLSSRLVLVPSIVEPHLNSALSMLERSQQNEKIIIFAIENLWSQYSDFGVTFQKEILFSPLSYLEVVGEISYTMTENGTVISVYSASNITLPPHYCDSISPEKFCLILNSSAWL